MQAVWRGRWLVLAIVFVARIGVGFQFIAVAALIPQIRADLRLDMADVGILLGVFMLAGVLLSLPSGMIAGRLGDRPMLLAGLVALLLGGVVVGTSETFTAAAGGRVIGGVGAVLITVTGAKTLAAWFAGREIATAMSFLGLAWPAGIALGISLLPFIDAWDGWRAAVLATATLPAAGILLVLVLPQAAPAAVSAGAVPRLWSIRPRELALVLVGGLAWPLMSAGGYVVFSSYAPGLLIERGMSQAEAGVVVSLLSWLIIVTIPLGGYLADRTGSGDRIFWGGCWVAAAAIAMVPLGGPVVLWIALSAALGFTVGAIMALPGEGLPPEARATGVGVYYTLYYLGTGALPAAAGWLQDLTGAITPVIWFSAICLLVAPLPLWGFRVLERRWSSGVAARDP